MQQSLKSIQSWLPQNLKHCVINLWPNIIRAHPLSHISALVRLKIRAYTTKPYLWPLTDTHALKSARKVCESYAARVLEMLRNAPRRRAINYRHDSHIARHTWTNEAWSQCHHMPSLSVTSSKTPHITLSQNTYIYHYCIYTPSMQHIIRTQCVCMCVCVCELVCVTVNCALLKHCPVSLIPC